MAKLIEEGEQKRAALDSIHAQEESLSAEIEQLRLMSDTLHSEVTEGLLLIANQASLTAELKKREHEVFEASKTLEDMKIHHKSMLKPREEHLQSLIRDIKAEELAAVEATRVMMSNCIEAARLQNNSLLQETAELHREYANLGQKEVDEIEENDTYFDQQMMNEKEEYLKDREVVDVQSREMKRQHNLKIKELRKAFDDQELQLNDQIIDEKKQIERLKRLLKTNSSPEEQALLLKKRQEVHSRSTTKDDSKADQEDQEADRREKRKSLPTAISVRINDRDFDDIDLALKSELDD